MIRGFKVNDKGSKESGVLGIAGRAVQFKEYITVWTYWGLGKWRIEAFIMAHEFKCYWDILHLMHRMQAFKRHLVGWYRDILMNTSWFFGGRGAFFGN